MSEKRQSAEVYDKTAKVYDSLMNVVLTAPTLKSLINKIPLNLPENPAILDIGCGTGLATTVISKRFPKAEICGLDYSEKMLIVYRKKFPKNKAIVGDFNDECSFRSFPGKRKTSLKAGTFDLVISSGSVSEYGQLKKVLPTIYRLLADGGVFLNIGIKEHPVNKVSSRVWKFKPANEKKFIRECEVANFRKVESISIPTILFPTNYLKYAVKAVK